MNRTRYKIHEPDCAYFLTCTIVGWLPVFSEPDCARAVLDSWRFLQNERNVRIHGFVIMENHLHWIAKSDDLAEKVRRFKSFTARQIIHILEEKRHYSLLELLQYYKLRHKTGQKHQVWQEESQPKQIISREMLVQKLTYMHNNPVRRGYIEVPEHWRYSSAAAYAEMPGILDVDRDWL